MKGLVPGEQSSVISPILQLFCRSGEFLTDMDSGTFRIDCISDPSTGATPVVVTTAFDASHKLGTGRYLVPTGDTALWTTGTHRAICSYTMEAGGKTYTQVIEFEILDDVEFVTGSGFVSYATSRAMLGVAALASQSIATLQSNLALYSGLIEAWTRRFFEPRYFIMSLSGSRTISLRLNEAIIAIEDVRAKAKYASGEEYYNTWQKGSYQVYNRHLDGLLAPDDRRDPRLELISDIELTESVASIYSFNFPYGHQNVELLGVFGYTDPTPDPSGGRVSIGRTPSILAKVLTALVSRSILDPTLADITIQNPGAARSMSTRAQSITFGGASASSTVDNGMSGDPIIDRMLLPLCAPIRIAWTDQRDVLSNPDNF